MGKASIAISGDVGGQPSGNQTNQIINLNGGFANLALASDQAVPRN